MHFWGACNGRNLRGCKVIFDMAPVPHQSSRRNPPLFVLVIVECIIINILLLLLLLGIYICT